jgi:hypothetical protein
MSSPLEDASDFDLAAEETVKLGNSLLDENNESDAWEVASGLLAGAVQFWLFSRQPCGDPFCDTCSDIDTSDKRIEQLLQEIRQSAEESDYYHTPNDANVGTA